MGVPVKGSQPSKVHALLSFTGTTPIVAEHVLTQPALLVTVKVYVPANYAGLPAVIHTYGVLVKQPLPQQVFVQVRILYLSPTKTVAERLIR